jgi:hypothetical protein
MDIRSGIYLRRNTPCVVSVGKNYVTIKYTAWNEVRGIWEYTIKERTEKRIFEVLNKEPARSLFFYSEKWDYGETKRGLINGKEIPKEQYRLRKKLYGEIKPLIDHSPPPKKKGKYE